MIFREKKLKKAEITKKFNKLTQMSKYEGLSSRILEYSLVTSSKKVLKKKKKKI